MTSTPDSNFEDFFLSPVSDEQYAKRIESKSDKDSNLSLFRYYGGKFHLLNDIYRMYFPMRAKTKCFVDVFGGSGKVLLNLPYSNYIKKIYNDIDSSIYNIMHTIQNDKEREKLINKLKWSLDSRKEFEKCKNEDSAYCFLYRASLSYGSDMTSFSTFKEYRKPEVSLLEENILKTYKTIRTWVIENLDYKKVLKKYDSPNTFFYLDPPYITRGDQAYKSYFTADDFIEMYGILKNVEGNWLMNESDKDFEEIRKIFGEPSRVITYTNHIVHNATSRSEGFWINYKVNDLTNTAGA